MKPDSGYEAIHEKSVETFRPCLRELPYLANYAPHQFLGSHTILALVSPTFLDLSLSSLDAYSEVTATDYLPDLEGHW